MLKDGSSTAAASPGSVTATAFRDDGRAELVIINELSFVDCRLSSKACFAVGERLRLHLRGQGWIEAEVRSASRGAAGLVFLTKSRC
jgi:hypothetical protein